MNNVLDVVIDAWPKDDLSGPLLRLLFAEVTAVDLVKKLLPKRGRDDQSPTMNDESVIHSQLLMNRPVRYQLHGQVCLSAGEAVEDSLVQQLVGGVLFGCCSYFIDAKVVVGDGLDLRCGRGELIWTRLVHLIFLLRDGDWVPREGVSGEMQRALDPVGRERTELSQLQLEALESRVLQLIQHLRVDDRHQRPVIYVEIEVR